MEQLRVSIWEKDDKVGLPSAATCKVNIQGQESIHSKKLKLHLKPREKIDIRLQKEIRADLQPPSSLGPRRFDTDIYDAIIGVTEYCTQVVIGKAGDMLCLNHMQTINLSGRCTSHSGANTLNYWYECTSV